MTQEGNYGQGDKALTKAADRVAEAKIGFDKLASNLESDIQGFKGKWGGAGGQAFFILNQAWTEKQKMIVKTLDDFEASLRGTEQDNIVTDEAQQSNMFAVNDKLNNIRH